MNDPITTDDSERVVDMEFSAWINRDGTPETTGLVIRFGGLRFRVRLPDRSRLDLIRALSGVPGTISLPCKLQPSTVPTERFVRQGYVILDGETLNARRPIQ